MKASVTLGLAVSILSLITTPANAKNWTITERMDRLQQEISAGQRSGDLTLDQAESLRNEEAKIKYNINKMKDRNGGKLGVEDQDSLEKQLNKLSVRIQKWKLEKRVK